MLQKIRKLFSAQERDARLQAQIEQLRQRTPVPLFWLLGRTQSGKTSLIKYLTGAEEAEIGHGFRSCTKYSRLYQFPTAEAPLLNFLDTRGLDEPGYDPTEDIQRFGAQAHVLIVTAKALDHGLETLHGHLRTIRQAHPARPVLLLLTCLHEAYPQQQHPLPYPFSRAANAEAASDPLKLLHYDRGVVAEALARSLAEQERRFEGLVDRVVPVDLTKAEEGYNEPNYGGELLRQELLDVLPAAYRQTLLSLEEASKALQDLYAQNALPHILGYSTLAATAGAIPVPWLDMLILPGIQTRMIYDLARLYGQPLTGTRFAELASTLGLGMMARQAVRGLIKFIPYVGSVAGAAFAGASTFALGKAFCYYYSAVHKGHVPNPAELRHYYQAELAKAEKVWTHMHTTPKEPPPAADGQPKETP